MTSEPAEIAPGAPQHRFPADNPAIAAGIFLLAALTRVHFAITHPHFDNLFAVRGVPYSDGLTWTRAAFSLASGHGLGGVYRPLYSVFLALFYTWPVPPFAVITIANIFFGALTASFIYLIADRSFNRLIALAAAVFFIFDPAQLVQVPQAVTEPLGLMLSVASVYYLLLTNRSSNLHLALLSGVLLALSNLARPLTLFCAPFYALYLFLQELWEHRKMKRALLVAAAFSIAIVACLAPWLIRQKLTFDIWSLSTNMGESFYAATSPKFKVWTPQVRDDAERAGIPPDQGHRYKFFMTKGREQLRQHSAFYFSQCNRAFWTYLNSFHEGVRQTNRFFKYRNWTHQVESMQFFFWVTSGLLLITVICTWRRNGMLPAIVSLLISIGLLLLWRILPPSLTALVLGIGAIGGWWFGARRRVLLLLGTLLICVAGSALFNNAILYRALLMTDWILALFYLAAFYFIVVSGTALISRMVGTSFQSISAHPVNSAEAIALPAGIRRTFHFVGMAAALFVIVSSGRLVYLNFVPGAAKDMRPVSLNATQQSEIRQHISELRGGTSNTSLVEVTHLSHDLYYFPANEDFAKRDPIFASANYNRSITWTSNYTAVIPGKIPSRLIDRDVALVGNLVPQRKGEKRETLRCVALVPLSDKGEPDYAHAMIAK